MVDVALDSLKVLTFLFTDFNAKVLGFAHRASGFLTAINAICSWVGQALPLNKFPHYLTSDAGVRTEFSARLRPLQEDLLSQGSHLVHACIHLSNACLALMGCSPLCVDLTSDVDPSLPSDAGASSFEVLGKSIVTFASKANPKSVQMDNSATPDRRNEKALTAIELLPEYQHILSWAWKTLKLTSDVLVTWLYLRVCAFLASAVDDDDASSDPTTTTMDAETHRILRLIGNQLIHILIVCRHKGTVEAVYQSLQQYLTVTARLDCFLQSCASNQKLRVLTVARALLTNLIRPEEVIDVCLAALSDCKFSVTRRAAGLWPASKAALLAELAASPAQQVSFATIIAMRLVGSTYSRPPPSVLEVFGRYPTLFDTFVAALKEVSSKTSASCLSSTAKLLVPLLGLLSRLSSSPPSMFP
ncbi:unnamed protein product [Dibothriocephalus latus]|uniref:DUF2428 domain-containing protein n=1 Tax=Dibothriocephalus latus TaxID=60516 RepID=A0A3P6TLW8_DIBLA|nr:unnamed protein product [Dibothriocephalus latus]